MTRSLRVLSSLSPLLLSSCMTMALWGYEWEEHWNLATHEYEGSYVQVAGTRWEWWRVLLRIVATPVTAMADVGAKMGEEIVTFGWLSDDEEDDDHFVVSAPKPRRSSAASPSPSRSSSGSPTKVPRSITSGATARRR